MQVTENIETFTHCDMISLVPSNTTSYIKTFFREANLGELKLTIKFKTRKRKIKDTMGEIMTRKSQKGRNTKQCNKQIFAFIYGFWGVIFENQAPI